MKAHQAAVALHVLALVIPAVALNAPLSATDETALATKLSRYTAMYKWMWELPIGEVLPAGKDIGLMQHPSKCTSLSQAWKTVADNGGCSSSSNCSGVTSLNPTACCENANTRSNAQSCEDTPSDWRKAQRGDDDDNCCDDCLLAATTDAYKARGCSGTRTADWSGQTVCGKVPNSDPEIYIAGEPVAFKNGTSSCSTGPDHEIEALDDSENACLKNKTDVEAMFANFHPTNRWAAGNALKKYYQSGGNTTVVTDANLRAILDKHKNSLFGAAPVVSGVAPHKAKITMQGGVKDGTVKANGCAMVMLKPYLNGDLDMVRGHAWIYSPTVFAAGTVKVQDYGDGNLTSAWVMGGSNKGTVNCTSSGQFYVHDLVNEAEGELVAKGTKDGFVSSVTNKGKATFINVVGSAVDITNNGAIVVEGTSHVNVKLAACGSGSTVVYRTGTKGEITAPDGCTVTVESGSSATVKRVTPTTSGQTTAQAAPKDSQHYVQMTVTMPYTVDEFNDAMQTSFKKAVASAAGTVAANVVIMSIKAASRRAASVKVETKILAADAAGVTALQSSLGTGDALKTKLDAALQAESLKPSSGVTNPQTGGLTSAVARVTASAMLVYAVLLGIHFVRI